MADKIFIAELSEGDFVQTTFLVTSKEVGQTRTGDPFLRLVVEDRSGRMDVRAWKDVEMLSGRIDVDDFVAVRGEVTRFGQDLYINAADLERLAESQIDPAMYFPVSRWRKEALFEQLLELVDEHVRSDAIRAFIAALFADETTRDRFCEAPAATTNHHAYRSGLIEHCLSMARIGVTLAEHYERYYPGLVDRDLLIAGIILHDFGKIRELDYRRHFNYTTEGRLVGHIAIAAQLVDEVAARAKTPVPQDLRMELKHLVLSHHGQKSYGSPVEPATPEALLLHEIDMIDSRMNMCAKLREQASAAGGWSDYDRKFGGRMYFRRLDESWHHRSGIEVDDLEGPGRLRKGVEPRPVEQDARSLTLDLFED